MSVTIQWFRLAALLAAFSYCSELVEASQSRVRPVTSSVTNGGVLHLSTGTWSRDTDALLGADVIYANTCDYAYFQALLPSDYLVDEGRVPSPTSPSIPQTGSRPGCAVNYRIDGFEIAYCTNQPSETLEIAFYDSYGGCAPQTATPVRTINVLGLPGTSGGATQACWSVIIGPTRVHR